MYGRYQIPVAPKGLPVTLVHDCCLTRGRSAIDPASFNNARPGWSPG